jgi:2-polyprenyl-3-methyl-5-hydroxy-6-metoxy-1,4-benzoquinol methylase
LKRCASCGLVFHNEVSGDAELREYYSHYYHEENLSFSAITEARYKDLLSGFERYRRAGRLLDVGCGAGHFLKVAIDNGWSAHGTEIAAGAFEHLSALGVNLFRGELQSAGYADGWFDVVHCSEVLEHLLDPSALLRECRRVLRPGGLLYLTTPNYNSLSRRLIGHRWRVIGKEHICYFTPRVLSRALGEAGFAKAEVTTRNIDPNELKKVFARRPAPSGTGFQAEATERLRGRLETNRALGLAKKAINLLLSATSTGDTLIARAQK